MFPLHWTAGWQFFSSLQPGYYVKQIGQYSFSCQKLGQISVRLFSREDSNEPFPSVLLSLSGEDGYRNNSITGVGGTFMFDNLFPGSFYLRPLLKVLEIIFSITCADYHFQIYYGWLLWHWFHYMNCEHDLDLGVTSDNKSSVGRNKYLKGSNTNQNCVNLFLVAWKLVLGMILCLKSHASPYWFTLTSTYHKTSHNFPPYASSDMFSHFSNIWFTIDNWVWVMVLQWYKWHSSYDVQEYAFSPPAEAIDLGSGESKEVIFHATRVAFRYHYPEEFLHYIAIPICLVQH